MQQGDCNAPATFMKLMNWIFAEQIGRDVYVYLDDILIFSKTKEEHISSLKQFATSCDTISYLETDPKPRYYPMHYGY